MSFVRSYHQTIRKELSEQTHRAILDAARELLATRWYDDISLADIAQWANVTVRTIQRRFGSKDAVAREALLEYGAENGAWRDLVPAGDVAQAVHAIAGMYEKDGDVILRCLSLESRFATIGEVVEMGRGLHRRWVARVFDPFLPPDTARREQTLALLVVATDVYTWKLLRRDASMTPTSARRAMKRLVEDILVP